MLALREGRDVTIARNEHSAFGGLCAPVSSVHGSRVSAVGAVLNAAGMWQELSCLRLRSHHRQHLEMQHMYAGSECEDGSLGAQVLEGEDLGAMLDIANLCQLECHGSRPCGDWRERGR